MSAAENPVKRRIGTAKEHLAGLHAAQVWIQDLNAAHLLRGEDPIRDEPITGPQPSGG